MDNRDSILERVTRRGFLTGGLAVATTFFILPKAEAFASVSGVRSLNLVSLHTGEKIKATYFEHGKYLPDALAAINNVLRDFRTGDVESMDRGLLDLLARLHGRLGSKKPFEIISGYRSPKSNAMLHSRSNGVAKHSMHMEGKAIDLKLADCSLTNIRNAALALNTGGVGYYPGQFVHVDTGRVRQW